MQRIAKMCKRPAASSDSRKSLTDILECAVGPMNGVADYCPAQEVCSLSTCSKACGQQLSQQRRQHKTVYVKHMVLRCYFDRLLQTFAKGWEHFDDMVGDQDHLRRLGQMLGPFLLCSKGKRKSVWEVIVTRQRRMLRAEWTVRGAILDWPSSTIHDEVISFFWHQSCFGLANAVRGYRYARRTLRLPSPPVQENVLHLMRNIIVALAFKERDSLPRCFSLDFSTSICGCQSLAFPLESAGDPRDGCICDELQVAWIVMACTLSPPTWLEYLQRSHSDRSVHRRLWRLM